MSNGLFLSVKEFDKLPAGAKLSCLYENQVKTFELLGLQKKTNTKIQITQKIQYFVMTILSGGVIFLIKHAMRAG